MSVKKSTGRKLIAKAGLPKPGVDARAGARGNGRRMNGFEVSIRTLGRRVEPGDVLLFFYLLALSRQYFWGLKSNNLAWLLTVAVALSFWCFALTKKEEALQSDGLSYSFYLIVALPLFVIYAIRFVFPDISYDVLNYHIFAAERALRGWPTTSSDYDPFPVLNPIPDMVTGIYRHILGYRVGTIVNYLTLVWVATILVKFIQTYFKKKWLIYLAVLLILLTETLLFEINNYLVDLLALPLLLQATYLVLFVKQPKTIGYSQFYIAFLLGLSLALKLTNVVFVIPIILVWAQRLLASRFKPKPILVLLLLLAFLLPLIPHSIYLRKEGNNVVPFSGAVTKTPLAFTSLKDYRWGPTSLRQAFVWPAMMYWKSHRVSELPVYAGKIPLGFILAFFFLPFRRIDKNIRTLSFIMIVGTLLWSFTTGYTRYASYLELISGLLIIYLSRFVADNLKIRESLVRTFSSLPWIALAVLSTFSLVYIRQYEWSMRPTIFDSPWLYLKESHLLFRDYSLKSFLAPEKAALFDDVGVWINDVPLMGIFEGLLKPGVPAINVQSAARFETQAVKNRFARVIQNASKKRMFSLCYLRDLRSTVDFLAKQDLGVGKIATVSVPHYSHTTVYHLALIEVLPRAASGSKTRPPWDGPLPNSAFQARIVSRNPPTSSPAGSTLTLYVTVKNISTETWPGLGKDEGYKLNLGNHWLDANGVLLMADNGRTGLPFDLKPQEEVELPLLMSTPVTPGNYILELDMVQERVAWFHDMGSQTLRFNIRVE